ncbi:MAG: CRISPR-associated DxTHG motif protein, partial [Flavobacterium sp.]
MQCRRIRKITHSLNSMPI